MVRLRLDATADRQELIMKASMRLSARIGFSNITRETLAKEAECSEALITYHYGTMKNFRRDIMRYAVRTKNLRVVAQGLAIKNPYARKAPEELKQRALGALA